MILQNPRKVQAIKLLCENVSGLITHLTKSLKNRVKLFTSQLVSVSLEKSLLDLLCLRNFLHIPLSA